MTTTLKAIEAKAKELGFTVTEAHTDTKWCLVFGGVDEINAGELADIIRGFDGVTYSFMPDAWCSVPKDDQP